MLTTDIGARRTAAPAHVSRRPLQASEHGALLACGDLAAACAAVAIAMWTWSLTAGAPFDRTFVGAHAVWFLAAAAWALALTPAHKARAALSLGATARALATTLAVLLGAYLVLYFYLPPRTLPRLVAVYVLWEGTLAVSGWRLCYAWLFGRAAFQPRVLIAGSGERFEMARAMLQGLGPSAAVAATHDLASGLLETADRVGAADIVVATSTPPTDAMLDALLQCQERGIRIVTFPQLYEDALQRIPVRHIDREWLLASFSEAIRLRDASALIKRGVDLAGGLAGTAALAALAPFIAAAIWIEDRGRIVYRQQRVGWGGSPFSIVKFRTMVADAEDTAGPRWAAKDDPRVTRVGRLLRRTRLDELPNLINVVRGEMSLVGPRPERPELVAMLEQHVPFYRTRLMVRPGITGWAQVNRPFGDETIDDAAEKLEYDLYYVKHRTLAFDLWILLKTLGAVLRLKGR
jgi:exopolysaccharide biosynthesis polyprenyl glycosylphosphotransferase